MKRPRREQEWLDHIRTVFKAPLPPAGIGDDCAILKEEKICVTTDTLAEGVDFERDWAPPEAIGWKALAINLSDLASMGAVPSWFLLTLAIPADIPDRWTEDLLSGIAALASKEELKLIGGDLSRSSGGLFISITAAGSLAGKPLLRGKSRPGDLIFVSSPLGGAGEALAMFRKGAKLKKFPLHGRINTPNLLDRFFRPPSQSRLGSMLAEKNLASSAIDISDGLLLDLSRLLEGSGNGAVLSGDAVPRAEDADGKPVRLKDAMKSGEEQVLLFTVAAERRRLLQESRMGLFEIGFVAPKPGIWLQDRGRVSMVEPAGFDHFER